MLQASLEVPKIIRELEESNLSAQCPDCGCGFRLSEALIFDALEKFPKAAQQRRKALLSSLRERSEDLSKRHKSAEITAEQKAIDVGLGKILEKVLPAFKGFTIKSSDCRLLYEPIDMIVFHGIARRKIESITFLEIKSGHSQLNKHQRLVRDAVLEDKVNFRVIDS